MVAVAQSKALAQHLRRKPELVGRKLFRRCPRSNQKRVPARIVAQIVVEALPLPFAPTAAGAVCVELPIQPCERLVALAAIGVDMGDLRGPLSSHDAARYATATRSTFLRFSSAMKPRTFPTQPAQHLDRTSKMNIAHQADHDGEPASPGSDRGRRPTISTSLRSGRQERRRARPRRSLHALRSCRNRALPPPSTGTVILLCL
jgi:hypothetical protein